MRNNKGKPDSEKYIGDIRLHIESANNFTQLEEFCQKLKTINNLEVIFYAWSEIKGLTIIISLKDSVPLVDKLRQMNMVEQAHKKTKKDIIVTLNGCYVEMISSFRKSFREGILSV